MSNNSNLTWKEREAVERFKEECDHFAFINYLERNNESCEKLYSDEEYKKFKELGETLLKHHEDSEQLIAMTEQVGDLMGDAELAEGSFLYNGKESIDSDTLAKIARINYYTIIEMQRCGYSPDEIEYLTYYWPY